MAADTASASPVRLALGQLEVFYEAARLGNYTTAARRLHVTPSAVSHAIRKLEAGVGRPLVEFRRRRFALTDDGEHVRLVCERVFHDLAEAADALAAPGRGRAQTVRVGATVEFGTTQLVRKLKPLADQAPWLRIDFQFHDGSLADLLLRDEIDLAVDCASHVHPSVQATRLFREKYVIVAAPAFLSAHRVRRTADLEHVPVLSLDKGGAWWSKALRSLPGRRQPTLRHIVEANQVRGMVHAAREGYGVALLPKYAVLGEVARGELTVLFPTLRLLEDWFSVYQKHANAAREKNRLVTDFLVHMDMRELGDAIRAPGGPAGAGSRRG